MESGFHPCKSRKVSANNRSVSTCTRSDAFKHDLKDDRSSAAFFPTNRALVRASDPPPNRIAHSRYAKSGPCVIVAPYWLAKRIQDDGSFAKARGE
jgi:hypothetical protein